MSIGRRWLGFVLVSLVGACGGDDPPARDGGTLPDAGTQDAGPPQVASTDHCQYEPPPAVARAGETVRSGRLRAGVAEAPIDLPIGSALGAYTARAEFLGTTFRVDERHVEISGAFNPSVGIETIPMARALALEAGGETVVIVKADLGIADEAVTFEVGRRLGPEMVGKVLYTVSHSHSAWGHWSVDAAMQVGFGARRRFQFEALVTQLVALARAALDARTEARIGIGYSANFDPENRVSRDRRGENDALAGGSFKDHHLFVVRVDRADGTPMAMLPVFGIHGIVLDADNPLASTDAPGAIERALEEAFDHRVLVMHVQGSGGDVSPAGSGGISCEPFDITRDNEPCYQFGRAEMVGRNARAEILAAWEAAGRSMRDDIDLEMVTRIVPLGPDWETFTIRGGALRYAPFDRRRMPDRRIFDEASGMVLSPIDEFSSPVGAALCGSDHDALFPAAQMRGTRGLAPYRSCMALDAAAEVLGELISLQFDGVLDPEGTPRVPVCAGTRATLAVLRLGEHLFVAMPGEVVTLLGDRLRALSPVGPERTVVVGYAQDHGGYLMTVEDWLQAGYEPSINFWGPLEGEYLAERADELMDLAMSPTRDDGYAGGSTRYVPDLAGDDIPPADPSPRAGTVPDIVPEVLYVRGGLRPSRAQPPATIRRLQSAHFVWIGEDPRAGTPRVRLEREQPAGSGRFVPVARRSGRFVEDQDLLLTHTPVPLRREGSAPRTHYYAVEWQAVTPWGTPDLDDVADRPGVPLGRYRFHVRGTGYELHSEPFEVVAGELRVEASREGDVVLLALGYEARTGWRLLHPQLPSNRRVPLLRGPVDVEIELEDGGRRAVEDVAVDRDGRARLELGADASRARRVRVTDRFGNAGEATL
ncbi:MAG: neutral/alkaline non-lysosomal ceramidase N-terminal domain-containing protein [Myxococcota bacterium]|nr:neutral/alkaline non-lysosomal ceramidase N-terminal domain-containing protein [Myxococcota bacterium]MDW8363987.1 neutral/alkaline non-lysosomal ceramidase N-terminal domain-containing protein [Myxococcales bacterium]